MDAIPTGDPREGRTRQEKGKPTGPDESLAKRRHEGTYLAREEQPPPSSCLKWPSVTQGWAVERLHVHLFFYQRTVRALPRESLDVWWN